MAEQAGLQKLRFDAFELDLRALELRNGGRLIKLQDQPAKLLALLASRSGQLVTREEIEKSLWSDDEFVEFEHSINTAIKKIREALGDDPVKPHFVETLPRKGYRFIAPVESLNSHATLQPLASPPIPSARSINGSPSAEITIPPRDFETAPASHHAVIPRATARFLFLLIQTGYLVLYSSTLYFSDDMERAFDSILLLPGSVFLPVTTVIAMCSIALRLYLISSVALDHPAAGANFRKIFIPLFLIDLFWSLSPLLLIHYLGFGLAFGCIAALAYLPFSQRTLVHNIYPVTPARA